MALLESSVGALNHHSTKRGRTRQLGRTVGRPRRARVVSLHHQTALIHRNTSLLMRFGFTPIRGSNPRASATEQALRRTGEVPAPMSADVGLDGSPHACVPVTGHGDPLNEPQLGILRGRRASGHDRRLPQPRRNPDRRYRVRRVSWPRWTRRPRPHTGFCSWR
jgi:hypothetical protein